jgi:ABC transporter with metal-binding/Fe-S-binding domain ATP-binding protein
MAGRWVGLFSGGKDSAWAVHRALDRGLDVGRLLTVHPGDDSYMYHTPATDLARLAAESIGVPLVEVDPAFAFGDDPADAAARGDAEVEPLRDALADLDAELDGGLSGVTVGAVASTYQNDRVGRVCDELGCGAFAPLWNASPETALRRMLGAGFEIRIVAVAAAGIDTSWLGRSIDDDAIDDLLELRERHGVHPLGEGGEFETLVTDGPHMARPIRITYDRDWEGTRGQLRIEDAWLASP